jgi:hypothetical protein
MTSLSIPRISIDLCNLGNLAIRIKAVGWYCSMEWMNVYQVQKGHENCLEYRLVIGIISPGRVKLPLP